MSQQRALFISYAHEDEAWKDELLPHLRAAASPTLVGRERERRELKHLLRAGEHRLVTLSGSPGLGKTRLARQIGASGQLSDHDAIVELLRHREPALLILDNFEQIVELAGDSVAYWIEQLPNITFLVPSRETLRVPGEYEYRLKTLDVPPRDWGADPSELLRDRECRSGLAADGEGERFSISTPAATYTLPAASKVMPLKEKNGGNVPNVPRCPLASYRSMRPFPALYKRPCASKPRPEGALLTNVSTVTPGPAPPG
jgi:hypothetical protein